MFKIKVNAALASETAAMVLEEKAKAEMKEFEEEVQKALDAISERIAKAADNGLFQVPIPYIYQMPEFVEGDEDDKILLTKGDKAYKELIKVLEEAGYKCSKIKNIWGESTGEFKISWDIDSSKDK